MLSYLNKLVSLSLPNVGGIMNACSSVLFAIMIALASFPAWADEWPADNTNSATTTVPALVVQSTTVNETTRIKVANSHPTIAQPKGGTFGKKMSTQANKMATTENPFNKGSNASVIAERRAALAAKQHRQTKR